MEKTEHQEVHVLMVSFASQGHINPMLRLAKRLISKNLHVTLATTEIARQRMLASSASTTAAVAASSIAGIRLEFFSDGLSLDHDRKSNLDHYLEVLGRAGPVNLGALIDANLAAGRRFSCVVNNPFVPWVADVAAEHGIPCALLWFQPSALYALYYRFYNELNEFPTGNTPNTSVKLPGLPLLETRDLPSFLIPSNPFGSIPKMLSGLFRSMEKLKWVLGNSFSELESEVIESMSQIHPVRPIGPLVPPELLGEDHEGIDDGIEMWKPDYTCTEWLDKQQPSSVVYISFGSVFLLSASQLNTVATALKKSNRPFLWVVKKPDYPVKDGSGESLDGFLEETKGQGLVVPWCPQIKVLKHPSVGCFLTHCGWNSLLETIAAGLPVIAYPQWTDQPTNAKFVADVWRIGARVRPDSDGVVTHDEIGRCIEEVMVGPKAEGFKKNATGLKLTAREAVADGGSSDRNIQLFVDEIIGKA